MPIAFVEVPGRYDNAEDTLPSGQRLRLRAEGLDASTPTIVLLHGRNAHSGTWRKNIPFLATTWPVLAPSLPPHGGSLKEIPILEYATSVQQLLQMQQSASLFFVGNSMGGWISMILASRFPDATKGMILENSAGGSRGESGELPEKLRELGIPALVLWGDRDEVISPEVGKRLAARLRNAEFRVLPGSGHVPHWDQPEQFNAIVREFLLKHSE